MRNTRIRAAFAFLSAAIVFEVPAFGDPVYNITNLNFTLYDTSIAKVGLNNSGQVIGDVPPGQNWQKGYAFVYDGSPGGSGTVTPLGAARTRRQTIRRSGQ